MKKNYGKFLRTSSRLFLMQLGLCAGTALLPLVANAQIAPDYEVATWHQFKPAAVSYTFDDNTPNQLKTAVPLFDEHGFPATFFTVTNWGPNWSGLKAASDNGHEITSHTVSHPSLNTLSVEEQETELQESQRIIKENVAGAGSLTIAYPNCNVGDVPTIEKYYIAGRICSGQIELSTPRDFYRISSLIAGTQGNIKTAANFNEKVVEAKSSGGWVVFLMHGLDNDPGFSPLPSSELEAHLEYVSENTEDYWVATFADVVKYIKERDAVSLAETAITTDSLQLTLSDNLDDDIYNLPITIRRALPANWEDARVYVNKERISSSIVTVEDERFIEFNAAPDQGPVYLVNADNIVSSIKNVKENPSIKIQPNPFSDTMSIEAAGEFHYSVHTLEGKLVEKGKGKGTARFGNKLSAGTYVLTIKQRNQTYSSKIIKR